jgi:hypothetical protein
MNDQALVEAFDTEGTAAATDGELRHAPQGPDETVARQARPAEWVAAGGKLQGPLNFAAGLM